MEDLEECMFKELSVEKAFDHMRVLVNDIGERIAGTEEMKRAAHYIERELKSYGLETRIDNFKIYHSYPKSAELRVIYPEVRAITAKPMCHICSTLPEGIEGELVFAGVGGYEDYEGKDVEGKIVLTGMTWAPPRPEKARIAYEKNAKALIIMNWGPAENPVIQMGGTKSQWGNPTPDSVKDMPQIPVIAITRSAGEYLKRFCTEGKVKVWLKAEASREWVDAEQPVGILTVEGETEDFILIGSHLEAWGKTAVCNSSGNALALELARILAKYKNQLKRNIVFAFWDGHEVAEAAGSAWFVDTNWDKLTKNCIAYVNIDSPGIIDTSVPAITSVTELKGFLEKNVREKWNGECKWNNAYKGGDASFFGIGVPYIYFATEYSSDKLKDLNYALLSPWLHSDMDTIDKIDKKLYAKHLNFFASLIVKLCNEVILPYDFLLVAEEIEDALDQLKHVSRKKEVIDSINSLLGITEVFKQTMKNLEEYKKRAVKIRPADKSEGEIRKILGLLNQALMKTSRELSHILWTKTGRYGHDPYGYSFVGKPIPILYIPIKRLSQLDENSHEFRLWYTELLRARNKVFDALNNSVQYTELILSILNRNYLMD